MKKEYHVYIGWFVFILCAIGLIPFSNLILFAAIVYSAFRANELKKEDERKGNRLIWATIAVFAITEILLFAVTMAVWTIFG
jgi:hypothetical protein